MTPTFRLEWNGPARAAISGGVVATLVGLVGTGVARLTGTPSVVSGPLLVAVTVVVAVVHNAWLERVRVTDDAVLVTRCWWRWRLPLREIVRVGTAGRAGRSTARLEAELSGGRRIVLCTYGVVAPVALVEALRARGVVIEGVPPSEDRYRDVTSLLGPHLVGVLVGVTAVLLTGFLALLPIVVVGLVGGLS